MGKLFLGSLLLLALLVFSGALIAGTLVYSSLSGEIEEGIAKLDSARDRETFETTQIFDRHGELLWQIFGEGKRTAVPLTDIPQSVIDATISVEDDTFYENIGADVPSLLAALFANIRNPDGRPVGGSTITQQIVRHIAFDYEERTAVSYTRKTKEIILAWIMNRDYTKDEILEMYLNEIYYGNLAYGIEAAAQTYFDKSASALTTGEATLLAGLPQSPVQLDPLVNLEAAKERQWLVLNLMVGDGAITQAEAESIYLEPLTFATQTVSLNAPHFSVYVRQQLEEMFGAETVANGGLRVTTSLDLSYQRLAEQLAQQHVHSIPAEQNLTNAAMVVMNPHNGHILAMVGSVDYHDDSIDGRVNVTLSPQQPGSAIKPLTYAAALSPVGQEPPSWSAADLLWDVEVEYPQFDGTTYKPLNYDNAYHGPVRLRQALANSYNVPAILLLQDIGVPRFMAFAEQMGIHSWGSDATNYGLSLTLGGGEVTPLELTTAYAIFANQGQSVSPLSILRVEKSDGELLYQPEAPTAVQLIDERVAFLISDILDDDVARAAAMGRDNPLALPFPAAAKTGTTNEFRDNWTMGYTTDLVVGVWTGNADNSPMVNISGLTGAAPLWHDFMTAVYSDYDLMATLGIQGANTFTPPAGLEQRPLCSLASATIGAVDCAMSGQEWFLQQEAIPPTVAAGEVVGWQQIEPAMWRATAVPLPPLPVELLGNQPIDEDAPPPQQFCHFAQGTAVALLPPDAMPQLFLSPPRNSESVNAAHEWAQAQGLAILPTQTCTDELLALARDPNRVAIYRITSPSHGETVSGVLPIIGIADFDPQQVQFYKIELGMPRGNGEYDWVTLGDTHTTPVINGQLEMLHADALPSGEYLLRLILVQDSNYVGEPHTISIIIGSS